MLKSNAVDLTSKVTGTLPVANGGTNLTSGFKNGITVAEQWKIQTSNAEVSSSADFTSPSFDVGINGSAQMTQSSGAFTFPSTGYYLITFLMNVYDNGEDHRQFANFIKHSSNSGSSYSTAAQGNGFIEHTSQGSNTHASCYTSTILDITDVSTHRVLFAYHFSNNSLFLYADGRGIIANFLRLGDT